jgi:hypothetical protein
MINALALERCVYSLALVLALTFGGLGSARAIPTQPSLPLELEVAPLFGPSAPSSSGWNALLVQAANRTAEAETAHLYLLAGSAPTGARVDPSRQTVLSESELTLGPAQQLSLELWTHGALGGVLSVVALDANGALLGRAEGYALEVAAPLLVDATRMGTIARRLNGKRPPEWLFEHPTPDFGLLLALGDPKQQLVHTERAQKDRTSGRLILPTRAAGYSAVNLLLLDSSALLELPAERYLALADWILSGGVLALVPSRDHDLQEPRLQRLLGGPANPIPIGELQLDPIAVRVDNGVKAPSTRASNLETVDLEPEQRAQLRNFGGGNLHTAPWGAVASYGKGEIHVLGFDPNQLPWLTQSWTELTLLTLLGHAWDHSRLSALPHAEQDPQDSRSYSVQQYLRGNHSQHRSLFVVASLLVLYALVIGPWNFARARRQANALGALGRWVLLSLAMSVLTFSGAWSLRSVGRRASHLTLLDGAAGMTRVQATRFRAFHASSLAHLSIIQSSPDAVMAIVNSSAGVTGRVQVDQASTRISHLTAKPWQTLVVREEGFAELGRGVSFIDSADGVGVKNQSGRDLAAVVVHDGSGHWRYFERIVDGANVLVSDGQHVNFNLERSVVGSSALGMPHFEAQVDDVAPGAALGWEALAELRPTEVDWWPEAVPALLAQVVGGEGQLSDSGFELEQDRVLLRVIGFGGQP